MNSYLSLQNGADWGTDFIERYGQPSSVQLIFLSKNKKYWASTKVKFTVINFNIFLSLYYMIISFILTFYETWPDRSLT